jgi:polygalacturonase
VLLLIACLVLFSIAKAARAEGNFNVRDFGATGDGTNLDTTAFQKALNACATAGGGTVVIPAGYYLIGSITIGGNTTVQLNSRANLIGSPNVADYPIEQIRFEGEFVPGHCALICARNVAHIAIVGHGLIYGPPLSVSRLRKPRGPVLMEFSECTNVTLDGFTTQYQQLWSIHPLLCSNVVAQNLTIRSVGSNGDGIDVDSCEDVLIDHCDINTGDDAISLKSGRGESAVRLDRPTRNVTIKDCTLVSSIFAALGIGSELSGGISDVLVENSTLSGRQNGISFKSREGRGGYIENFTGKDLTFPDSRTFLAVNLLDKGIQAKDPVTGNPEKWTRVSNIQFENIQVKNVSSLLMARDIPNERPVNGFSLIGVSGNCLRAFNLANMTNVVLANINVTNYSGPFLVKTNVQGFGLSDTN